MFKILFTALAVLFATPAFAQECKSVQDTAKMVFEKSGGAAQFAGPPPNEWTLQAAINLLDKEIVAKGQPSVKTLTKQVNAMFDPMNKMVIFLLSDADGCVFAVTSAPLSFMEQIFKEAEAVKNSA